MSNEHDVTSTSRRPHTPSMAEAYLEFDLPRAIEDLRREPEWAKGQNAKTLVKFDTLRVVLMVLAKGARIPEHQTSGRISIQPIQGHLRVHAGGRTFDAPAGRLLSFDRDVRHDVEALEESAFLLTIAWEQQERPAPA